MATFLQEYGYRGFMILGMPVIILLTVCRRKQYGMSVLAAILYMLTHLTVGIFGAVTLFAAKNEFTSFSGMAFYGGIFLILVTMPLLARLFRLTPGQALDVSAPALAAYSAVFRFGCLVEGCCGGSLCNLGSISFRWPTQMMESFGDVLILAVLLQMSHKEKKQGLLYPTFLVMYGTMRFVIECLRDMEPLLFGLTEGHWNSLLAIVIGSVWLFRKSGKSGKQ